ncbi:Wzz/FepE/Etk N-terminal domain-containing protein [Spirosoma harenae]
MSIAEDKTTNTPKESGIEIRLNDIITVLKSSTRRLILGGLIGLVIGALYAFSKPNIFKSTATLLPEVQSKSGMGGLSSLAGLAGLNVDNINGPDAIRPELYPDVLKSIPFALELLKQEVYSKQLKTKLTFEAYITETGKSAIGSMLAKLFPPSSDKIELADPKNFSKAIQLTTEQYNLTKAVLAGIDPQYDKKSGIITITATETDPVVAATVARLSVEYLTNYITGYRTEKARRQVIFLEQRVSESKARYQAAEYAISNYRDRNRNVYLETAKINEQRLQADYLLEQTVYNDLSKQLEQAKIKVQEDTPVFKVLEPPTVPLRKSAPGRTLIMLGFAVVGAIVSLLITVVRKRDQIFRAV